MFYTFNQNNSGGSFIENRTDGIAEYVIIEADSADEANDRAENIGIYFNGCSTGDDCSCCGDRWYAAYESDAEDSPKIWGMSVEKSGNKAYVHYKDGTVKSYNIKHDDE